MRRWERKGVYRRQGVNAAGGYQTGAFRDEPYTAITTDFDTVGELAAFIEDVAKTNPDWLDGHRTDASGENDSGAVKVARYAEYTKRLRSGREDVVREAERLLATYETAGLFAPMTPIVRSGVVGFGPNVPAYLAGQPETMLRMDTSEAMSERSPITIMIDCGVMASCNTSEIIGTRGVALLTLVLALQSVRPVSLRLFDTMSIHGQDMLKKYVMWAVTIPTQPLHVAQLANCLCSREFATALPFTHTNAVMKQAQGGFGFAWRLDPSDQRYEAECRKHWQLEPQDLCFTGGSLTQGIGTDPMGWVQRMLDKIKRGETFGLTAVAA